MSLFGKKNDKENEPENTSEVTPVNPTAEEKREESVNEAQTETKKETPEGFKFDRYFLAERRVILDNVSYETQRPVAGQLKLNVKDMIVAQVIGQTGVKVTYNRALNFVPDGPFRLSVTFGVMLIFNPGTRDEIDWRSIDLAAEFKKNCPALVELMSAKASLLVAELTNASGGNPMILRS